MADGSGFTASPGVERRLRSIYRTLNSSYAQRIEAKRLTHLLYGSETILLVEDQDAIRDVASEFLKGSGYIILEARDGIEALQVAEQHHGEISLLLTDVVMPRMGGPDLALRLANLHPQMKIIYMSGYTEYPPDSRRLGGSEKVMLKIDSHWQLWGAKCAKYSAFNTR